MVPQSLHHRLSSDAPTGAKSKCPPSGFLIEFQPQMNASSSRISRYLVPNIAGCRTRDFLIPSILSIPVQILYICVYPSHLWLIRCSGTTSKSDGEPKFFHQPKHLTLC